MGVMKVPGQKVGSLKAAQWAGTNTHRHTDNRKLTQQDGREKKTANLRDKRDNNFVEITFRQTSPFFKQIFL